MQVCGRCGEEKPAAEFPARKFSTSDGLHSYCRSCKGTAASRPGGGPPPSAQVCPSPLTISLQCCLHLFCEQGTEFASVFIILILALPPEMLLPTMVRLCAFGKCLWQNLVQADKQDMDAAASAAMQRAEAAAAVEASLASAASGAAIVPPESLPQQVPHPSTILLS